jgi:hypothetical protein
VAVILVLFGSIAWLIYFFQSERVSNTYGEHGDFQSVEEKQERIAEPFNEQLRLISKKLAKLFGGKIY